MALGLTRGLTMLLGSVRADAAVVWQDGGDGRSRVVACAPAGLVEPGDAWPGAARAADGPPQVITDPRMMGPLVPISLRLALPSPPVAVVPAPLGDDTLRLLVVWSSENPPPGAVQELQRAIDIGLAGLARWQEAELRSRADAARLTAVVGTLEQAVVFVDDQGGPGLVNEAAARLLGVDVGDVSAARLAAAMTDLRSRTTNRDELATEVKRLLTDPDAVVTGWLWTMPENPTHLRVSSAPLPHGGPSGRVWVFDDVSLEMAVIAKERELQRVLDARARHDDLTGLANRHEVFERLEGILGRSRRTGDRVALVFCDVDRFKDVNDTHGHAAGDALLRALGARLRGSVRSSDLVARIGGDELLVVLDGVHSLDEAVGIAESLRVAAGMPIEVPGATVRPSLSLGVTLAGPADSVDEIVARADRAMYEAKQTGRGRVTAIPVEP